eukprot:TRINITY_DN3743_c1_g2_i1.p1 TRINITY_DN3743_c1_g2~~TRINITY_DN3743_c1_g2_i1.p1  ORF type:complete len:260 (-),score=32.25 TRINITY_DN3743_c1_g2_i1:450-1229(-)
MQQRMVGRRARVLILGGWSPGPLEVLQNHFRNSADFFEPTIPMPPAGCRWCLNPFWALLLTMIFGLIPALNAVGSAWKDEVAVWIVRGILLVATPFLIRLLIAGLVWFAIRDGVRIAENAIREIQPDIVLAFSWGGGVACWLLAHRGWSGPTILLAPTVRAMSCISCSSLPKIPAPSPNSPVHVFHAEDDGFCPESQIEELQAMGCEVHVLDDNHVLLRRNSINEVGSCLEKLFSPSSAGTDPNPTSGHYSYGREAAEE